MAGEAGAQIATTGTQPPIGAFVQDLLHPNGATNFMGCNPEIGYSTNSEGITIGAVCATNYGTVLTGGGSKNAIYCSTTVVLIPTDRVDVTAGVATKNNATGIFDVLANVPAGGFFWAVTR